MSTWFNLKNPLWGKDEKSFGEKDTENWVYSIRRSLSKNLKEFQEQRRQINQQKDKSKESWLDSIQQRFELALDNYQEQAIEDADFYTRYEALLDTIQREFEESFDYYREHFSSQPHAEKLDMEWLESVQQLFQEQFADFREGQRQKAEDVKLAAKHGILLLGRTGTGKSSLINAILGIEDAKTGSGEPVTHEFTLYYNDKVSFKFWDSPGWEGGKQQTFAYQEQLKKHFKGQAEDIDIIWYTLDAQSARLTHFEIDLLKDLPGKRPIIFVLTKCDIASDEQIIGLMQVLFEAGIPGSTGIFPVSVKPLVPHEEHEQERFSPDELLQKTAEILATSKK